MAEVKAHADPLVLRSLYTLALRRRRRRRRLGLAAFYGVLALLGALVGWVLGGGRWSAAAG
ncbi:MAG TPA: hypothetical protein VG370_34890 [Chloroflexota bacterium]|jgi:zinc transporter ZupT|nr:hypothetical protein [Chloroflexota bacterium]